MSNKTITAFLCKEPMATKNSNTDGRKIFYNDTCMGQWKEHSVLINNTRYGVRDVDTFVTLLQRWAVKSSIIYKLCSKAVPLNSKDLKTYE